MFTVRNFYVQCCEALYAGVGARVTRSRSRSVLHIHNTPGRQVHSTGRAAVSPVPQHQHTLPGVTEARQHQVTQVMPEFCDLHHWSTRQQTVLTGPTSSVVQLRDVLMTDVLVARHPLSYSDNFQPCKGQSRCQ